MKHLRRALLPLFGLAIACSQNTPHQTSQAPTTAPAPAQAAAPANAPPTPPAPSATPAPPPRPPPPTTGPLALPAPAISEAIAARAATKGTPHEQIYPLGFSKNGLFAYIREPAHGESGVARVEVLALDNPRPVWMKDLETTESASSPEQPRPTAYLWADAAPEVLRELRGRGIERTPVSLEEGAAGKPGEGITLQVINSPKLVVDYGPKHPEFIQLVASNLTGIKEMLRIQSGRDQMPMTAALAGFFQPPEKNLLVAVLEKAYPGQKGPPVVLVSLVSTRLDPKTFKPSKP